tara:strand:+ start:3271 stop:3567 length:297 start_codon:yes stop_codon:yes gene_type:complete
MRFRAIVFVYASHFYAGPLRLIAITAHKANGQQGTFKTKAVYKMLKRAEDGYFRGEILATWLQAELIIPMLLYDLQTKKEGLVFSPVLSRTISGYQPP